MRRRLPRLFVPFLLVLGLSVGATAAAAQDVPPPGAIDGIPVGAEPDPPPAGVPEPAPVGQEQQASGVTAASTPPERYFSREAYEDIEAAVAAAARPCAVSNNGLKALVLSPIFFESSGATSPSSAPAPMTLSRYDEWNPSYPSTTSNLGANRSLYAQRNPYTSYPRAFWHPGIGIWQYDSAGLGAPYTAVERMDARVIAPTVAARVLTRYCNAKAAGQSDLNARKASWGDWVGCASSGCETVFQQLIQNGFGQMRLLDGIGRLGGAKERTCALPGRGQLACAYVDPNAAQGARWWVSLNPNDGNPTKAPAPLSTPFYVFELDGREHRHWLSADSGYSISLSASRTLGRNARYRTDQAGSGLTWETSSALCDLTTGRGACVPQAPPGISAGSISVNGTYRAFSLDATGDGRGDVLWYGPGSSPDVVWLGGGSGSFSSRAASINGTYDHVLTGDVDGDGRDDVLWYARSTGAAYLWRSQGDGSFSSLALSPGAGRIPLMLDTDGNDQMEVFWYGPGGLSDSLWRWQAGGFVASARSVSGQYLPFVGDFDGNGRDDIFWYAPGPAADHLWLHRIASGHLSLQQRVSGLYQPLVGNFDGDCCDDIFWYAPGSPPDAIWFGGSGGSFADSATAVAATYTPVVADLQGDGRDDVVWYAAGPPGDYWWRWNAGRSATSSGLALPLQHQPVVGAFSAGGQDGILWHQAGSTPDVIWYR
ncbi:MAG: FG-GAP-like repeat-containing protein [Acidimicrobiales bacterium]